MKLNKSLMLILSLLIVAACELPEKVVTDREPICTQHAASIAWLLANGERQFVLALDKNNTLAGGC